MPSVADLPLLPKQLKKIKPFLQRARETESKFPQIAYYCCKYAATLGTEIVKGGGVGKECTQFLMALLDGLDASKKALGQMSDDQGQSQILAFAMKIFKRADDKYRNGNADKMTGKALYAAGNFLTVLKQFGPMDKKLDNLRKYALISASRILKALRLGQRPMPPDDDAPASNNNNNTPSVPIVPSVRKIPSIPPGPGFEDKKPHTSSSGLGFDIPPAPGFEDNKPHTSSGGLGFDIPPAPGFEDNNSGLDIPPAPGFEDETPAKHNDDVPVAPKTKKQEDSGGGGAAAVIRNAEEFIKSNKYQRALECYLQSLDMMMKGLKTVKSDSPAYKKLYGVMGDVMAKAETLKQKLKKVPNISDKFTSKIMSWQGLAIGKRFGADAILVRAMQMDKKEYYVDAVASYEEALALYIGKVLKAVDPKFKTVLYGGLQDLMTRAETIKKALKAISS